MADKADEKEIEGAATEAETEEEGTGTDQTKTDKTFSQDDVNKIVAKEKAKWARTHGKDKEEWGATETSLQETIDAQAEVIQQQVDLLKKDLELDEITVELLADKPALEQFKILTKIIEKRGKQEIPRTPTGKRKEPEFQSSFRPRI